MKSQSVKDKEIIDAVMKELKALPQTRNPKALSILQEQGKTTEQMISKVALDPASKAAYVVKSYSSFGDLDISELRDKLAAYSDKDFDMSRFEAHISCQAMALDSIFNAFAARANSSQTIEQMKAYLALAFKAKTNAAWLLKHCHSLKILGHMSGSRMSLTISR